MAIPSPKQIDDLVNRSVESSFTIQQLPNPVGHWKLPGATGSYCIMFAGYKRPRWLTIKMMWWIFEWKWEEAE
jgi:hypothetical protein